MDCLMLPLTLWGSSANSGAARAVAAAAPAAFRAKRRSGSSRVMEESPGGSKFVVFVGPVAAVSEDQQAEHEQNQYPPRQARAGAEVRQSIACDGEHHFSGRTPHVRAAV